MPVGVRTHGRGPPKRVVPRTVPRNPRAHFEDYGRTRTSTEHPWGQGTLDQSGGNITQSQVDAARADAPVAVAEYQRSPAGQEDIRRNEIAVAQNRRDYNETPPENRQRRGNTQGQN